MISYLCCTLPYLRARLRFASTLSTHERLVLIIDRTKAPIRGRHPISADGTFAWTLGAPWNLQQSDRWPYIINMSVQVNRSVITWWRIISVCVRYLSADAPWPYPSMPSRRAYQSSDYDVLHALNSNVYITRRSRRSVALPSGRHLFDARNISRNHFIQ